MYDLGFKCIKMPTFVFIDYQSLVKKYTKAYLNTSKFGRNSCNLSSIISSVFFFFFFLKSEKVLDYRVF